MHADNPLGSKVNYSYYHGQIDTWATKTRMLLNSHIIKLLDDDNLYLIHMKEPQDEKVHGYVFGKLK